MEQGFYRLFIVPGMTHCQGGEGPASLGQSLDAPSLKDDPDHDVRRALEAWGDAGHAPARIIAGNAKGQDIRRITPEH